MVKLPKAECRRFLLYQVSTHSKIDIPHIYLGWPLTRNCKGLFYVFYGARLQTSDLPTPAFVTPLHNIRLGNEIAGVGKSSVS